MEIKAFDGYNSLANVRRLQCDRAEVIVRLGVIEAELEEASGVLVGILGNHESTAEQIGIANAQISTLESEKVLLSYRASAYARAIEAESNRAMPGVEEEFKEGISGLARCIEAASSGIGEETTLGEIAERYRTIREGWVFLEALNKSWRKQYPSVQAPIRSLEALDDLKPIVTRLETLGRAVSVFQSRRRHNE